MSDFSRVLKCVQLTLFAGWSVNGSRYAVQLLQNSCFQNYSEHV